MAIQNSTVRVLPNRHSSAITPPLAPIRIHLVNPVFKTGHTRTMSPNVLPVELVRTILYHCCLLDVKTTQRVSLICRWARDIALPHLIETVYMPLDRPSAVEHFHTTMSVDLEGTRRDLVKNVVITGSASRVTSHLVDILSDVFGMLPSMASIVVRGLGTRLFDGAALRSRIAGNARSIALFYDWQGLGAPPRADSLGFNVTHLAFSPAHISVLSNIGEMMQLTCQILPNLRVVAFDLQHPLHMRNRYAIPDDLYTSQLRGISQQIDQIILILSSQRGSVHLTLLRGWFRDLRAFDARFMAVWSTFGTMPGLPWWSDGLAADGDVWDRAIAELAN